MNAPLNKQILAIFDICGTLYHCNTLFAFVRAQPPCKHAARWADSLPVKLADRLFPHKQIRRNLYVRALNILDRSHLTELANHFVQQYLPKCIQTEVQELFEQCRANHARIVLYSNAPDFLVSAIAQYWHADRFRAPHYHCGQLFGDKKGRKEEWLQEESSYDTLWVCTDNLDDDTLLQRADMRHIITVSRHYPYWRARFDQDDIILARHEEHSFTRKNQPMKFLLPFTYGFATRVKSEADRFSFLIIFLIPVMFICAQAPMEAQGFALRFILGFTTLYSLYECGYLQNDAYTTKREPHPTIRLPAALHAAVCRYAPLLIGLRVIAAAICIALLALLGQVNVVAFSSSLLIMLGIFTLHNQIRSRGNILTYFLTCSLKYISLPLLFLETPQYGVCLSALLFSFVLPRSIEHAAKAKYGLRFLAVIFEKLRPDAFRAAYYALLSVIGVLLWIFDPRFFVFAALMFWFFAYRGTLFLILRKKPQLEKRLRIDLRKK